MLHLSVLPVHRQFGRLLANLKYVIVDEGHSYKGERGQPFELMKGNCGEGAEVRVRVGTVPVCLGIVS